jgi:hypothetical protein
MGLENTLAGAGEKIVDEASVDLGKLVAELPAEAKPVIDYFMASLRQLAVGRTITFTITIK